MGALQEIEKERESAEKRKGKERETENLCRVEREWRKRQKMGRKGLSRRCGKMWRAGREKQKGNKRRRCARKSGSGQPFFNGVVPAINGTSRGRGGAVGQREDHHLPQLNTTKHRRR
jgi:hypothetical protein